MLNFDVDRFLSIQGGAVGLADSLDACVRECMQRRPVDSVYFVGSGGAGILMYPAAHLLARSSSIRSFAPFAAEVVLQPDVHLGPNSLVIAPSRSGTTAETVTVMNHARSLGAATIALVAHGDTPVTEASEFSFVNFAADDTSSESFYLQSLLVTLSVMQMRGDITNRDEIVGQLALLPQALVNAKEAFEERAAVLAQFIADSDYHIISGSGNVWPEAYYYSMCILEEMQWIRTRPVHASDFFHGTLELVEADTSLLLLKGEDHTRPLVDRVETFARTLTDRVQVIDSADVELAGISAEVRALVAPAVFATLLERVNAHLEVIRDHPLTTRRYYRQIAY
ncbi:MAG: SIS domain-containing protein [Actinobacteria bacterium]|nr:SIS domain-containing protein [Actinomycetota bacterium]